MCGKEAQILADSPTHNIAFVNLCQKYLSPEGKELLLLLRNSSNVLSTTFSELRNRKNQKVLKQFFDEVAKFWALF